MNTRQNYRKQAEQRIKNTPEMRSLLHLFKRSWGNCDELWETLATRPTGEIIQFILDLNEYALTKAAYHEAGHLVIAILVGLEYENATIVPGFEGEEYIRGHLYSGKGLVRHNGFAFFFWRRLLMIVAGAAATVRLTKEKPGDCKSDMTAAVNILGKYLHEDVFSEWLEITGYSMVKLIDDSAIWTAIDWFAQQLLNRGTIQITPSVQKRIKKIIENSGGKPSAAFHLGRMLSACDGYTELTNEELQLQHNEQKIFSIMRLICLPRNGSLRIPLTGNVLAMKKNKNFFLTSLHRPGLKTIQVWQHLLFQNFSEEPLPTSSPLQ